MEELLHCLIENSQSSGGEEWLRCYLAEELAAWSIVDSAPPVTDVRSELQKEAGGVDDIRLSVRTRRPRSSYSPPDYRQRRKRMRTTEVTPRGERSGSGRRSRSTMRRGTRVSLSPLEPRDQGLSSWQAAPTASPPQNCTAGSNRDIQSHRVAGSGYHRAEDQAEGALTAERPPDCYAAARQAELDRGAAPKRSARATRDQDSGSRKNTGMEMATEHFPADETFDFFEESGSELSDGSDCEYFPSDDDSWTEKTRAKKYRKEAPDDGKGGAAEIEVTLSEDDNGDTPCTGTGDLGWTAPDFKPPSIPPFTAKPGVNIDAKNFQIADFFYAFVTHEILEEMVTYTNLYAEQSIAAVPHITHSRAMQWHPTNVEELKKFLGLTLAMGIVKKPTIRSYWDMHSVLCLPLFSAIMTRNRYEQLLRFLNFNSVELTLPPNPDRLHKLRPLISSLNARFAEVYTPCQNLTINESRLLYKGRVMHGNIPNERPSYGIKLYTLCESSTGYTRAFKIGERKEKSSNPSKCPCNLSRSGEVVWDLVEPLLHEGYHLYVDNNYTSVALFNALRSCSTVACGIVSRNQKGLPHQLLAKKPNLGESFALRNGDLLALKYTDKISVLLLSTIHDESTTPVRSAGHRAPTLKPVCLRDYNKYMGGADRSEETLPFSQTVRKSTAWYRKVAVHLIQLAALNSYVVYKTANPGTPFSLLKFKTELITQLVTIGYDVEAVFADDTILRLTGRHFLSKIPATLKRSNPQKRCRVCYSRGIRKDSRYYCPDCPSKPGLCADQCYKRYHTVLYL